MAKRFTDSEKFRDKWYRSLSPKHKCIWEYMLSECNIAGILEIDYDSMSFHIGAEINKSDLSLFSEKIFYLSEEKVFIPNFVKFQQNKLSEVNNAHKNIIKEFIKYNIPVSLDMSQFESPLKGASKGLQSPISNSKGKGKGKGKGKKAKSNIHNADAPDDVSQQVWDDFLKLRKSKNAPVTDTVLVSIRNQAESVNWTLEQALVEMCARGWQGFKAEWVQQSRKETRNDIIDRQTRECLAEGQFDSEIYQPAIEDLS